MCLDAHVPGSLNDVVFGYPHVNCVHPAVKVLCDGGSLFAGVVLCLLDLPTDVLGGHSDIKVWVCLAPHTLICPVIVVIHRIDGDEHLIVLLDSFQDLHGNRPKGVAGQRLVESRRGDGTKVRILAHAHRRLDHVTDSTIFGGVVLINQAERTVEAVQFGVIGRQDL